MNSLSIGVGAFIAGWRLALLWYEWRIAASPRSTAPVVGTASKDAAGGSPWPN